MIEHSGQIRDHQQGDRARGLAPFDSETRESLRRRAWHQPALTRPGMTLALVLVMALHALFALALWYEMKPEPTYEAVAHIDLAQALTVRLIDQAMTLPAPTRPDPPPPMMPRVRPVTHERARRDAMVMQDHQPAPAPSASVATPSALSLFAKDGSVRLTPATATASTPVKPVKPADDRQIMQHDSNRMQYKATRFEKYFPPPNETAGGAAGRHIGNVIKAIAKSVCDPKKKSTASNLLCGVPPPPASPKDRDERLNLPPPPLAGDPHPARSLPLSTCIADYKADKPLPYGCPIDTPDLAFKAEVRECIDLFRAGKRLKTWCPLDTPERAAAETSAPAASSSAGSH